MIVGLELGKQYSQLDIEAISDLKMSPILLLKSMRRSSTNFGSHAA